MKAALLFIACLLIFLPGSAQVGVGGGATLIKGIGVKRPYTGIHIGVEIPRDDEVSYFGRLSLTLRNKGTDTLPASAEAIDPSTFPVIQNVGYMISDNFTTIEGGTRYYLGSGYDYGWSAYGGSVLMLVINSVRADYADYDESKYRLQQGYESKGSIVGFNLGLNGGVKNHFPFGMLYFDVTATYGLFAIASSEFAKAGNYSLLTFAFNVGFRKDLY